MELLGKLVEKKKKINIKNHNNLEECIIFGFPDNDDNTKVLNHCILLAKYHIYIQKLKDNDNIDMYAYLAFLKQQLSIEEQICMNERKQSKFDKYLFIYDML